MRRGQPRLIVLVALLLAAALPLTPARARPLLQHESTIRYTFPATDTVFPEGIAYHAGNGDIFVGSTNDAVTGRLLSAFSNAAAQTGAERLTGVITWDRTSDYLGQDQAGTVAVHYRLVGTTWVSLYWDGSRWRDDGTSELQGTEETHIDSQDINYPICTTDTTAALPRKLWTAVRDEPKRPGDTPFGPEYFYGLLPVTGRPSDIFLGIDPGYAWATVRTTTNCPDQPPTSEAEQVIWFVPDGSLLAPGTIDSALPGGAGMVGALTGSAASPTTIDFARPFDDTYTQQNSPGSTSTWHTFGSITGVLTPSCQSTSLLTMAADAGTCGLSANAGGPYTSTRGQPLTLDGSGSAPAADITSYRWAFQPGPDCPSGIALANSQAQSTQSTRRIVARCDLTVTLTIQNAAGETAAATTTVDVQSRRDAPWSKTAVSHREATPAEAAKDMRTPVDAIRVGAFASAVNVSTCTDRDGASLCPDVRVKGTLEGKAYTLAQVNDPGGPFAGFYYPSSTTLKIDRLALFNPNLSAASKRTYPDGKSKATWYDYNLRHHPAVLDAYLRAVREHEGWGQGGTADSPAASGHTGAMALAVASNRPGSDPVQWLEMQFAAGRTGLVTALDTKLKDMDFTISAASIDPRPQIFSGTLSFWDGAFKRWSECTLSVGGSAYLDCPN